MPSLYELKPRFQALLRPLVAALARAGFTANQITIATCVVSLALGAWLTAVHRLWILLPIFCFVRMAMNAVDGLLAREFGQASTLGAALNELSDVLSDGALTLPFVTFPGTNPLWIVGAVLFGALTEMAGLLSRNKRRHDGPFGKSDRAFALGAIGTWLALDGTVSAWALTAIPAAWIALCAATIVNRVRRGLP